MRLSAIICAATVVATGVAADAATVTGVSAFHRSGQTFVTWTEVPGAKDVTYSIYRSDAPISDVNLAQAEKVAAGIHQGSGVDVYIERSAEALRIVSQKDPCGPDWYHIVDQPTGIKPQPQGYVITAQGKPIGIGTGLYVHSVKRSGPSYYAVTAVSASGVEDRRISPGVNALSEPVAETPGTPSPIMEKSERFPDGNVVRHYIHWSDSHDCVREGVPFKFQVGIGPDAKDSSPNPMMLMLHSAGGPEALPLQIRGDFITVAADNISPGVLQVFDWWYGYNSNIGTGQPLAEGTDVNYTERRLLRLVEWTKKHFRIDENRIFVGGVSMGGTGSVSFGMRHPGIFAAIYANVPQVNPGSGQGPFIELFESMWGKRADAVKTNDGPSIWDRLNMIEYVRSHHGDLPFIKVISARDDVAMPWSQIPPFLKALGSSKHGFIAGWNIGGHNLPYDQRPMPVRRFDIYKLARNLSFPALCNSSLDGNPGSGSETDGAITGVIGGGYDWTIIADTPDQWQAEIRVVADGAKDAVVDITPRRLQRLRIHPGRKYAYTNADSSGRVIQQGVVTADEWGLVTLPRVTVSPAGSRITVKAE